MCESYFVCKKTVYFEEPIFCTSTRSASPITSVVRIIILREAIALVLCEGKRESNWIGTRSHDIIISDKVEFIYTEISGDTVPTVNNEQIVSVYYLGALLFAVPYKLRNFYRIMLTP